MVDAVTRFLAVLAVVAGIGGVLVVALRHHAVVAPLRRVAVPAAATVAVAATAGSLFYSEVAGFVPCELCWWQRLAMYPAAVLLVVATVRREDAVRPHVRLLAGGGLAVSLWHVAVQRVPGLAGATSCSADAPCTAMWVDVFGVLSIPAMAACGFVAVLGLLALPRTDGPAAAATSDTTTSDATSDSPVHTSVDTSIDASTADATTGVGGVRSDDRITS